MKITGLILLLVSGAAAGGRLTALAAQRVRICRELVQLCEDLLTDIRFRATPLPQLFGSLLTAEKYPSLSFIKTDAVRHETALSSPLKPSENQEIAAFLYSLGKSDAASQTRRIAAFQEMMKAREAAYAETLRHDAGLYISFGIFIPAVLLLILV